MKKRKLGMGFIVLLLYSCLIFGIVSTAAETESREELNLRFYISSDSAEYENVVIVDYVVYEYRKETDTFAAILVDETDSSISRNLKLKIRDYIYGRPVTEVSCFIVETDPSVCKVVSITLPDTIRQKELNFDFEHGGGLLKTIIFAGDIRKIGLSSDPDASELKSVVLSSTATASGRFASNSKLKSVVFPKGMKKIENMAFTDCISLKRMTLPDGVTKIGKRAFAGCRKLQLYVPSSVKQISKDAFGTSKSGRIQRLYCVKNSAAHKYAKKNKISYTLVNKKVAKRKITGLASAKKALTMTVGEQRMLEVTVKPFYAAGQKLSWNSSDTEVLTVSKEGQITAKSAGKAVITVRAKSGVKTKVTVTVKQTGYEPGRI